MQPVTLAFVMAVEFPGGTARWSDGGFVHYDGHDYLARDPNWGVLTGADSIGEGLGNEIPGFRFSCAPPVETDVYDPANNGALVTLTLLELDGETHEVLTVDTQFIGMIGGCSVEIDRAERTVEFEVVAQAERAFLGNVGNRLDPTYHKAMWAGERGEDNATGVGSKVAWGARDT